MKKKPDFEKTIKLINALAKLTKAAKCYNCIHKFEPKKKTIIKQAKVNEHEGELILPNFNKEKDINLHTNTLIADEDGLKELERRLKF